MIAVKIIKYPPSRKRSSCSVQGRYLFFSAPRYQISVVSRLGSSGIGRYPRPVDTWWSVFSQSFTVLQYLIYGVIFIFKLLEFLFVNIIKESRWGKVIQFYKFKFEESLLLYCTDIYYCYFIQIQIFIDLSIINIYIIYLICKLYICNKKRWSSLIMDRPHKYIDYLQVKLLLYFFGI